MILTGQHNVPDPIVCHSPFNVPQRLPNVRRDYHAFKKPERASLASCPSRQGVDDNEKGPEKSFTARRGGGRLTAILFFFLFFRCKSPRKGLAMAQIQKWRSNNFVFKLGRRRGRQEQNHIVLFPDQP